MNINKFTQKSLEAVNSCEKLAYQYGSPEIDQEHFLYSLLTIEDSLILKGLQKNNKNISTHLLTVLTISVILQLEQRKGVLRKEKIKW